MTNLCEQSKAGVEVFVSGVVAPITRTDQRSFPK
jgi:hypothetical protein